MRRILTVLDTLASIVIFVVVSPLMWAMRADLHERNTDDAVHDYPYDDNDPGEPVDEHELGGES